MSNKLVNYDEDIGNASFNEWDLHYRIRDCKVEYNLTWKRRFKAESICRDVIKKYELGSKDSIDSTDNKTENPSTTVRTIDIEKDVVFSGDNYYLDATDWVEEILKLVLDKDGKLAFVIRFKGLDQPRIISSRVVNAKIPYLVEEFYRKRPLKHGLEMTLLKERWGNC